MGLSVKKLVVFVLSCLLLNNIHGQNKLDNIVVANRRIEGEIVSLEKELDIINDSISKIIGKIRSDSSLLMNVAKDRDLLIQQGSEEIISELKHDVDSLDDYNNILMRQLREKEAELTANKTNLNRIRSEMADMEAFIEADKRNHFDENLLYTKQRFSKMDMERLCSLKKNESEFSSMKSYDEYIIRISFAIANKKIYEDGKKAIMSPYDADSIRAIRYRIIASTEIKADDLQSGIVKLTDSQFSELDSLDIKLSRYKNGVKFIQTLINSINEDADIQNGRGMRNRATVIRQIRTYIEPAQGTELEKSFLRYVGMVPYLKKMLDDYTKDIYRNPFVETASEKILFAIDVN